MYFAKASRQLDALFQFDVLTMSPLAWLAVLCLAIYLSGAIALWKARKRWSITATLSFTIGCILWFLATGLNGNVYADELISVLLFQQITLMVVVPPFLLLGSPGRLLLRATPRTGIGRPVLRSALATYRSSTAQVLLHPATAIVVAALAFPALYLSDAVSWFLAIPQGHLLMLTLFIVFGVIAGAPLWSLDPLPRSPSYVVRIVGVLIEIQIHAIFGLVLLMSSRPMFRWYVDDPESWGITRALDQAIGGGLIWSYGELPLILVLIVTISKWRKSDLRQAKRRQPQEDEAMDVYNAYLSHKYGSVR